MSDVPNPIIVSASSLTPVLTAIVRHALTLAGGLLVSRGYLDQQTAGQVGDYAMGIILALAPAVWAAVRAKLTHEKLVTVAEAAPDSVAKVA